MHNAKICKSTNISDYEDRLDTDGTYLQDCCNIKICSARDINKHGCLLGSAAPRCSYEEKQLRRLKKKN